MKIIKKILCCTAMCTFLLLTNNCYSQLTVNAGTDTTFCRGLYLDTFHIGKNMVIENGNEPYSYKWECEVKVTDDLIYTAGDFLNDTTIRSPFFIDYLTGSEWIKFYVEVKDAENNFAKDSLNVRFSGFSYLTAYIVIEAQKGDTLLFNQSSVGGGIEPLHFYWQPVTGLSNADSLVTWCYTDSLNNYSTNYEIVAVDSCGCISAPNQAYEVRIVPTDIHNIHSEKGKQLRLRLSGTELFFENHKWLNSTIKVYALSGQLIFTSSSNNNHFDFEGILNSNNIYIASVTVGGVTENLKIKIY